MDGALSSDRHSTSGGGQHQSGERGGYRGEGRGGYRGGYRGGGGRRGRGGRGRHHPYRRDDYGGGRHSGRGRHNDRDDRDGGGGGGYRGGRGGYRGGRGGGGYHGNGGGGRGYRGGGDRGPRQPANRFSTETKSIDPQYAMMKQLTAMVAKMGDLGGAADVAATTDIGEGDGMLRPVVKAIGTNVSDLVEVLCGPNNAALFLKFGSDEPSNNNEANENETEGNDESMNNEEAAAEELAKKNENKINASEQAGGLSTLLLSCAYGLPLQTPSYAALTLGVDVKAPKETHAGFAKRCIELGMRIFGRDLDLALECAVTNGDGTSHNATNGISGDSATHGLSEEEQVAILKQREDQRCFAEQFGGSGNGSQIDAYCRVKLLLRYFAHLATIGVVSLEEHGEMSLVGMLETLVEAASRAAHHAGEGGGRDEKSRALLRASQLLASLVLSTIPYLLNMPEMGNARNRLAEMVDALENNVVGPSSSYSSQYDPGSGPASILLKGELDDAPVGTMGDDDEEEEDDDDDDDDDEQPAVCADTLQDLLRTVRKLISAHNDSPSTITRFALLDDVPWMALTTDVPVPMEGGMEMEGNVEKVPMSYEGEPLMLDLIGGDEHRCRSIPYLMSIENYTGSEGETVQLRCHSLDGIIYGRLSIFDAPPNPDDDEEEEDDAKKTNPNLESYVKTFSLVDRFFLSDAVRDVLTCHRPMVSDAGAERNTAKEVAEQIWDVSHLFKPPVAAAVEGDESNNLEASKGIEYGIIETLLSLIVQCTSPGSSMPSSSPTNSHLYLSRVLLELTKLKPSLIPQAIVLATSDMFQDFLPSFTPTARENLAKWLGFHLVNTEYQWPKAYWDHWAPYASAGAAGKRNSRGEFIQMALNNMAILSSDGAVAVVKECLPAGSALVQTVFLNGHPDKEKEDEVSSTEKDLINRLWNTSEDPDTIRQFIISDELSESHTADSGITENVDNSMTHKSVWWRARLATRALFHPILREKLRTARVTENAWKLQSKSAAAAEDGGGDDDNANNEGMDDDNNEEDETEDLLADVLDAISRFKPVLLAALARDADAYDSIASGKVDDDALLLAGEVSILQEVGNIVPKWDLIMGSALMECLMRNGIVSGLAVARWALTEHGDESVSEDGGEGGVIHTDWWKYVSLAILHTLRKSCSQFEMSKTDLGGGIGMIIDDGNTDNEDPAETAALRLDEALKSTVPILKYVTERACQVLAACAEEKKIPLSGADLVEGMKCLLRAVLFHFHSIVLTSSSGGGAGILTAANVQKGFASMDADGEKLALVCQAAIGSCKGEQGKRLLQSLSLSLEKML